MQRFLDKANFHNQILNEVKNGKKETHWMWFAFPQIEGLGKSEISKFFAIRGKSEAQTFIQHEVLGRNLIELCNELLKLKDNNAEDIFGGIDASKLKSSMTLFYTTTKNTVFNDVLEKFFDGQMCEKSKV